MKNIFKKIFSKASTSSKKENIKWQKVRINNRVRFDGYSSVDAKNLKDNAGKIVFVRKVGKLFYAIKQSNRFVFFLDFENLDDDEYLKQIKIFSNIDNTILAVGFNS